MRKLILFLTAVFIVSPLANTGSAQNRMPADRGVKFRKLSLQKAIQLAASEKKEILVDFFKGG